MARASYTMTTPSILAKLAYPHVDVLQLIGSEQRRASKFFDEVMALGALERARFDVLEILDVRFGAETAAEFKEAVEGITDMNQLSQPHRRAIKCRLPEFRRALPSASSAG